MQSAINDIFDATHYSGKWAKITCTDERVLFVRGDCFSYVDYPDEEDVEALLCDVKDGESEMFTDRMIKTVELPA